MESKRSRGRNFSENEKSTLIGIIMDFKDIVENKKTDGATIKSKNKAWDEICSRFNAATGGTRNKNQLMAAYKSLKHKIKKNINAEKVELYKTAGGNYTPASTPVDERIFSLLQPTITPLNNPLDTTYFESRTFTEESTPHSPTQDDLLVSNNENDDDRKSPELEIHNSISTHEEPPVSRPKKRKRNPTLNTEENILKNNLLTLEIKLKERDLVAKELEIELKKKDLELREIQKNILQKELEIKSKELEMKEIDYSLKKRKT